MTRPAAVGAVLLAMAAGSAGAQEPVVPVAGRRGVLRFDSLRLRLPAPWSVATAGEDAAARALAWELQVRRVVAARGEARWRALRLADSATIRLLAARAETPLAPMFVPDPPEMERRGQLFRQYAADLGLELNAVLELRLERLKNLHCTAGDLTSFSLGCRDAFNPPRVDAQFDVRSGGVIGQRLHLNVDYDTQREFDASNNIQVYYQGLEDEILRRVEVGNVSFQAPRTRFIAGGIPTNNFGLALQAQIGALDLGAIYAQQKGNVVRARTFTVGDQTVLPVDRLSADRDFEPQRFFFVVNPRSMPGYPAVDVLDLGTATPLPDTLRPTEVRVYRHRSTIGRPTGESNLQGIQAVALRSDSPQRQGPINWEVLVEGRDYYLDPTGTWFALTQRVDQDDFLAVSYVTASGDTVGTFPSFSEAGTSDTLELIFVPRSTQDLPTFYYEMRQVYRVGAIDDVARTSVALDLLVGGSQRPESGAPTFLQLLGLALASDATRFDEYNRLWPRQRDPGNGLPLRELYVVFPHLTPFADSVRLPPAYRTDSLYRTPTYDLRTTGPAPLFQLNMHYDARGGDGGGSLMLGGFQIRQGSERVTVAGRQLVRNVDYTVNYEIGQLTFARPDSLFRQPTQVVVQFEENSAFSVAPTTVMGLQGRYDFGEHGSLSALAVAQRQRTTFTRPPLGFEPASSLVAGLSGDFRFRPLRLTRWLDALPLVRTEVPSTINVEAEIATSRPSPNQVGVAYVETFEGEGGLFLSLGQDYWEYGSRPSSERGIPAVQAVGFQDADATLFTWQNLIPSSAGQVVQLRAQDIDPSIRVIGTGQQAETVLWGALHADTLGGITNAQTFQHRWFVPHTPGPRWRSIVQPLSGSGIDLTRIEFLEFWVLEDDDTPARNAGLTIAFDFGTVFEDAAAFQPDSFITSGIDTTYLGRRRAGQGRLDTERDTLTGTFNAATDDLGVLGDVADSIVNGTTGEVVRGKPLCQSALSTTLEVYTWGSVRQHCTRRNGQLDTEDLNNDQHLDTLIAGTAEDHVRYVVGLGDPRYEVRTGGVVPGVGTWRLYRIPFRSDTIQVGSPNLRQIRALRMTITAPDLARPESTVFFALARMRLVGAPWIKRTGTPIAGLSGDRGEPHGAVIASVVSTENVDDLGYEPPPGVSDAGQTVGDISATQINERSLRLLATDVRVGERAEAYFRFPEGERNFLGYRQLRVWARGRGDGWSNQELRFYVKVGQDAQNFYLYRVPARSDTWVPEVVVDFDRWHALRAQIEQGFLEGQPPFGAAACGGDSLAYVACSADGAYVVHVRNPSIAPPNLTRVQELAVGLVRDSGSALDTVELWIDDIRLSGVVNTPGYAGAIGIRLLAADVADLSLSATTRDGNFRQLGENPSYVGTSSVSFNSTIRLERFGLERLGIAAPFTIRTDRTRQDPFYLNRTDVLASGLQDVREPVTTSTSYSLSLRRSRRGVSWWERALVNNIGVSALWAHGGTTTELSRASSKLSEMRADYSVSPGDVSVPYLPGFLRGALEGLPRFLRESDMVRGLLQGRLRLTPATLQFNSGLSRASGTRSSFRVPVPTPFDTNAPVVSSTAVLRNFASMGLRPFGSMTLSVTSSWTHDLKDYGDSSTMGLLTSDEKQRLLGLNLGFVASRQLVTRLAWNPPVASWLRPRLSWTSNFALNRDPQSTTPEREEGDSAGAFRLPTTFANNTVADVSTAIDFSRLVRGIAGPTSAVRLVLDRVTLLDVGRRIERRSQYSRAGVDPGAGYQLGLTGLGGFLRHQGRLANAAADQRQNRVNIGIRAPLGLTATSGYVERASDVWFRRIDDLQQQETVERDWPNLQLRWLISPRGGPLRSVLSTLSLSAGYLERSSNSRMPSLGEGPALTSRQTSLSRPLSVGITWAGGIVLSVTVNDEHLLAERSGNTTQSDRQTTAAGVSFMFRTPQEFLPIKAPVRGNIQYQRTSFLSCIERSDAPGCTLISDSRRNEYNLTMDTDLPPTASAGLSVGYVLSDDKHLNRRFSQLTFTLRGRITFTAGQLR